MRVRNISNIINFDLLYRDGTAALYCYYYVPDSFVIYEKKNIKTIYYRKNTRFQHKKKNVFPFRNINDYPYRKYIFRIFNIIAIRITRPVHALCSRLEKKIILFNREKSSLYTCLLYVVKILSKLNFRLV